MNSVGILAEVPYAGIIMRRSNPIEFKKHFLMKSFWERWVHEDTDMSGGPTTAGNCGHALMQHVTVFSANIFAGMMFRIFIIAGLRLIFENLGGTGGTHGRFRDETWPEASSAFLSARFAMFSGCAGRSGMPQGDGSDQAALGHCGCSHDLDVQSEYVLSLLKPVSDNCNLADGYTVGGTAACCDEPNCVEQLLHQLLHCRRSGYDPGTNPSIECAADAPCVP